MVVPLPTAFPVTQSWLRLRLFIQFPSREVVLVLDLLA